MEPSPFRPSLVGHIGVDPYYLTHKALEIGHHPEMILRADDSTTTWAFTWHSEVVKLMTSKRIHLKGSRRIRA
jgi:UDP-N-acetyl-D-galactosamine dehydrogenase